MSPMLGRIHHPKTRNTVDPHRTRTQVRRSNRRQEQREVRDLAANIRTSR